MGLFKTLKETLGKPRGILYLSAFKVSLSLLGIVSPRTILKIVIHNTGNRPYSPTSLIVMRWAMCMLFILGMLEFKFLKPGLKRNSKPKARNNYFLHSLIEMMIIFDISTIILLIIIFYENENSNQITICVLIVILAISLSMRATWLTDNTREAYELEALEEKHAKEKLFPSVARTIAESNNPESSSIPREENPLNTMSSKKPSSKKDRFSSSSSRSSTTRRNPKEEVKRIKSS